MEIIRNSVACCIGHEPGFVKSRGQGMMIFCVLRDAASRSLGVTVKGKMERLRLRKMSLCLGMSVYLRSRCFYYETTCGCVHETLLHISVSQELPNCFPRQLSHLENSFSKIIIDSTGCSIGVHIKIQNSAQSLKSNKTSR